MQKANTNEEDEGAELSKQSSQPLCEIVKGYGYMRMEQRDIEGVEYSLIAHSDGAIGEEIGNYGAKVSRFFGKFYSYSLQIHLSER